MWHTSNSLSQSNVVLVKDLYPGYESGAFYYPAIANNKMLFFAENNETGYELFSLNDLGEVELVKDINPGISSSADISGYTMRGGIVVSEGPIEYFYFAADDGVNGFELWRSDGTPNGTNIIRDIYNGIGDGIQGWGDYKLIEMGGSVFFQGRTDEGLGGLWKSDGTSVGTIEVMDSLLFISYPVVMDNILYFSASDLRTNKTQLWRSDGTTSGTFVVTDEWNSCCGLQPENITLFNGRLLFSGIGDSEGRELWTSDGSASGTSLVMDINQGNLGSNPKRITYNSEMTGLPTAYFIADNGLLGEELWKTDGSAANTILVKDINPGPSGSNIGSSSDEFKFTILNNHLYFSADDGIHGQELWLSNGSPNGTFLKEDIKVGTGNSNPGNFYVADDYVYFRADDADWGFELHRLGLPTEFVQLLEDINGGSNGSFPAFLTFYNDRLYFAADESNNGYELRVLQPETNPNWDILETGVFNALRSTFCTTSVCYAVGADGMILKSTDNGATWAQLDSGVNELLTSIHFTSDNIGFVTGSNGLLLKTSDAGNTWNQVALETTETLHDIAFTGAGIGWICGNNGTIYNTTDGGNTWQQQTTSNSSNLRSIFFVDSQFGWLCGFNGTILHTQNGGNSWVIQNTPIVDNLFSISFSDETNGMAVGANGVILKTTDAGATWNIQPAVTYYTLYNISLSDNETSIITGSTGTVLISEDSGDSWNLEESITTQGIWGISRFNNSFILSAEGGRMLTGDINLSSGNENQHVDYSLLLYPNPTTKNGNIRIIEMPNIQINKLTITDMQGIKISEIAFKNQLEFQLSNLNLSSGLYHIVLTTVEGRALSAKIVVE